MHLINMSTHADAHKREQVLLCCHSVYQGIKETQWYGRIKPRNEYISSSLWIITYERSVIIKLTAKTYFKWQIFKPQQSKLKASIYTNVKIIPGSTNHRQFKILTFFRYMAISPFYDKYPHYEIFKTTLVSIIFHGHDNRDVTN